MKRLGIILFHQEMLMRLHCFKTNISNSKGSWKLYLCLRAQSLIWEHLSLMCLCTGPERPKKEHTEREMQNFPCQLSGMNETFMQNQSFWEPWKKGEDPHHTITAAPCTEWPGLPPSEMKSTSQPWELPWHFISSSDQTIKRYHEIVKNLKMQPQCCGRK